MNKRRNESADTKSSCPSKETDERLILSPSSFFFRKQPVCSGPFYSSCLNISLFVTRFWGGGGIDWFQSVQKPHLLHPTPIASGYSRRQRSSTKPVTCETKEGTSLFTDAALRGLSRCHDVGGDKGVQMWWCYFDCVGGGARPCRKFNNVGTTCHS